MLNPGSFLPFCYISISMNLLWCPTSKALGRQSISLSDI